MLSNRKRILAILAHAGQELKYSSDRVKKNLRADGITLEMIEVLVKIHHQNEERKKQKRAEKDSRDRARRDYFLKSRNNTAVDPETAARIRAEAEERQRQALAKRKAEAEFGKQIIAAGYRAVAKKHHPDAGGNADDMRIIHNVRDRLKANV